MKPSLLFCWMALLPAASAVRAAPAPEVVRRFALVAGADDGGGQRVRLKYAMSDARRFARVLTELGGVSAGDVVLLSQPSAGELEAGLDGLRARVASARADGGSAARTEVLLYYSGHADDRGLLLGDDRLSYRTVRDKLDEIPSDVRIAVLDACASGAITRLKGGQARPPFLVDASSSPRGHAFLTSSAAGESAQESDRIGGSYFTHYLVSGMRGAADSSGEGTVTLLEAYQFAFRETLGGTVETRGGVQHPSYDINMSGSGDVVMTDLRQTTAGLVLTEGLEGRCYVRDAAHGLVVELEKPVERRIALGLPPGKYEVRCQDARAAMVATPLLQEGRHVVLATGDFAPAKRDATLARGSTWSDHTRATHRVEVRLGLYESTGGLLGVRANRIALNYGRWLTPHLSLNVAAGTLGAGSTGISSSLHTNPDGTQRESAQGYTTEVYSALGGVRYDLVDVQSPGRWRPYASLCVGPYARVTETTTSIDTSTPEMFFPGRTVRTTGTNVGGERSHEVVLGAQAAVGVDWRLNPGLMLGPRVSYDGPANFQDLGPALWSSRGFELSLGVAWVIGGRR
jgi:hypothetical protein